MKKLIIFTTLLFVLTVSSARIAKAEGFVFLDNAYYYVYDDGSIATNTQKGIFYIGPTGRLTVEEVLLQAANAQAAIAAANVAPAVPAVPVAQDAVRANVASTASGILSRIINDGMTDDQKIRACFNYVIAATSYLRTYDTPVGDWTPAYALQTLTTGQGNCYRYAAALAYLLKAAGYETRDGTGQIHAARGGLTPHGWTEINLGGQWYTIDSEMQDAKKDKYNFYLIPFANYPIKPLIAENYWAITF